MPSSMIFASLVVLWLLILVPAVARHRQEVVRPSVAALSGRVLARPPRRRSLEVDAMDERDGTDLEDGRLVVTQVPEVHVPSARQPQDDAESDADDVDDQVDTDEQAWERPPARYRAGRGGFDAEAAALAARARYAFRQRVVLAMLVLAVATGIVAGVALPFLWWAHGAVDVMLVGYLVYLRRQVRMEEAIRARRAARMAGTRRPSAADDPELDEWAERGRAITRPSVTDEADEEPVAEEPGPSAPSVAAPTVAESKDAPKAPVAESTPAATAEEEERPALPRLRPTPPPPLPPGTALVDEEDDELVLDDGGPPGYRRAVGQ
ncbi:MAG: hypothetical protein JOY78_19115 [Pseudonocardia sp.]|nr:hypothetical protein [Pseudonocardia sp.]